MTLNQGMRFWCPVKCSYAMFMYPGIPYCKIFVFVYRDLCIWLTWAGVYTMTLHDFGWIYGGNDRQSPIQFATKWRGLWIIDWPLSGLQPLHINSHQVHSFLAQKIRFSKFRISPFQDAADCSWPCVNVLLTEPWQCTLWPWWIWCGLGPHWFERRSLNLEPLFKWTSLQLVATKKTSPWCCCSMRSNGNRFCPSWRRETATLPQISACYV